MYVYANQKLWIWPCDKNSYYQNWLKNLFPKPCMLHDASRKGWWTFKIKVRLICLIYFKETFTNESYLYFESPPSPRKTSCNIRGFGNKFLACYRIKMFFAFTENLPKLAYDILEAQRRYVTSLSNCVIFLYVFVSSLSYIYPYIKIIWIWIIQSD